MCVCVCVCLSVWLSVCLSVLSVCQPVVLHVSSYYSVRVVCEIGLTVAVRCQRLVSAGPPKQEWEKEDCTGRVRGVGGLVAVCLLRCACCGVLVVFFFCHFHLFVRAGTLRLFCLDCRSFFVGAWSCLLLAGCWCCRCRCRGSFTTTTHHEFFRLRHVV